MRCGGMEIKKGGGEGEKNFLLFFSSTSSCPFPRSAFYFPRFYGSINWLKRLRFGQVQIETGVCALLNLYFLIKILEYLERKIKVETQFSSFQI